MFYRPFKISFACAIGVGILVNYKPVRAPTSSVQLKGGVHDHDNLFPAVFGLTHDARSGTGIDFQECTELRYQTQS